ncbi:hypothetical protein PF005_g11438 [Phytophthora fragariae]|uniref:Uncharacterized protein n=1 Tax=Phytophthora fragariae TaxID=53985 RepID=A0A6A3L651_9STRA|nr:hypothetical protein PF003_g35024 [Phytophthora fragariae]KAE8937532.1 hypothetical protein PF009_g12565 [Phytophthora fragariae]KAE9011394.1 hypothetical protein PF011_g9391 [Phytophthora fragariae]KAE9110650.1 hypothetical protein PF010_g11080 [Phytophthora fragariae]KAE9137725.1 hypothetical protein PF007_g1702 [Phytophthora fragariae]
MGSTVKHLLALDISARILGTLVGNGQSCEVARRALGADVYPLA